MKGVGGLLAAALEDALIASADGDFGLVLLAFLIVALVGCFIWAIRKVLEQNSSFNSAILRKMDEIVSGMKDYRTATCYELEKHDLQAKEIMKNVSKIETTLENRPCVAGGK